MTKAVKQREKGSEDLSAFLTKYPVFNARQEEDKMHLLARYDRIKALWRADTEPDLRARGKDTVTLMYMVSAFKPPNAITVDLSYPDQEWPNAHHEVDIHVTFSYAGRKKTVSMGPFPTVGELSLPEKARIWMALKPKSDDSSEAVQHVAEVMVGRDKNAGDQLYPEFDDHQGAMTTSLEALGYKKVSGPVMVKNTGSPIGHDFRYRFVDARDLQRLRRARPGGD